MAYYADPNADLPAEWKLKRAIFYACSLKVYGQIPYILQRRLGAEFISNIASGPFGGRVVAPTGEDNYTVVPYRRADGECQSDEALAAFLSWLEADAGYEWAIAAPGEFERRDLRQPNWWRKPPQTWIPDPAQGAATLRRLIAAHTGEE